MRINQQLEMFPVNGRNLSEAQRFESVNFQSHKILIFARPVYIGIKMSVHIYLSSFIETSANLNPNYREILTIYSKHLL